MLRPVFVFAGLLLLLVSILGSPMAAASQATSGVITGVITDAQGAVLPGVTLTLRNAETGFTRTAVTEADGRYRVGGLPPGRYELKAELSGFARTTTRLNTRGRSGMTFPSRLVLTRGRSGAASCISRSWGM